MSDDIIDDVTSLDRALASDPAGSFGTKSLYLKKDRTVTMRLELKIIQSELHHSVRTECWLLTTPSTNYRPARDILRTDEEIRVLHYCE